jgi:hypothetical protein
MRRLFTLICILALFLLAAGCKAKPSIQSEMTPTGAFSITSLLTGTPSPTAAETKVPAATAEALYAQLLDQLREQDPDLDFAALRIAYSQTEAFNPYGGKEDDLIEEMWAAVDAKDYAQALDLANQVIEFNELSPRAHMGAVYASNGLGKLEQAEYHQYVARGIIESILESGDGKSPETAYVVIAVPEEYVILSVLGVRVEVQQWDEINGHNYDFFEVIDQQTDDKSTIYFNIDIPWNWLRRQLQ